MDYKQETIDKIRESCVFDISDKKLEYLYRTYSMVSFSANWITPTAESIRQFCNWTLTSPLDAIIDMPETDFE